MDNKQTFKTTLKNEMKQLGLDKVASTIKSAIKRKFQDKDGGFEITVYVKHDTTDEVVSYLQAYMNQYKKGEVLFAKVYRAPEGK